MGETKRRAGIRRDNTAEKVWKDIGGNQDILSIEKFGGYKTEVKKIIEGREMLALIDKAK